MPQGEQAFLQAIVGLSGPSWTSLGRRRAATVDPLINGSYLNHPDLFLALGSESEGNLPLGQRHGPAQHCAAPS